MGKVQCNSTHNKEKSETFHDQLTNNKKKQQNWYEKKLTDEYSRLKDLTEKKRKILPYEYMFGYADHKKQLSRLVKWSKIAYQPLPKDFYEKKQKEVRLFIYINLDHGTW